tara:strand:+ start:22766 stop:23131 length:366 start_codon:yes stop_codon:yes gene_type:complete
MEALIIIPSYLAIGAAIGFTWARFMPRWNLEDARDHVEGLDCQWSDWESHWMCDCPVHRKKDNEARTRDFWLFQTLWIYAVPVVIVAAGFAVLSNITEKAFRYFSGEPWRTWFYKFVGGDV